TSEVRAITTLEFEFLDSGQTVAPTDQVVMRGRVTNTGDTPLLNALASGGVNLFIHAPAIFSNYVETPGGFGFGPIGLFPLDPGESVDFTVATWSPWPIGGSAGDPVPLGDYEFPASAFIHITYTEFIPFIPYSVD